MNELERCICEYSDIVNSIFGTYLDSKLGFDSNKQMIENAQSQMNLDITELENNTISYGTGNPEDSNSVEIHRTTQREYKQRNSKNGNNYKFIGNMCLISIYQYWEDYYRGKIATLKGIAKNDLKSDIMGDLRWLRMSIIHHKGIAMKDVEKCKILKWYKEGDEIFINQENLQEIIMNIKIMLIELLSQ